MNYDSDLVQKKGTLVQLKKILDFALRTLGVALKMVDSIVQSTTGRDLDDFSDDELSEKIANYHVFARFSQVHFD